MTVSELISALSAFKGDAEVYISGDSYEHALEADTPEVVVKMDGDTYAVLIDGIGPGTKVVRLDHE